MTVHQLITEGYGVGCNLILEGYCSQHYGVLERILAKMEQKSIGTYCFEPDVMEPGIDNAETPLRKLLERL